MSTVAKKVIMGSGAVAGAYEIDQSLIFNGSNSYLDKTFSGAGNRDKWTFSCWIKRSNLSVSSGTALFAAYDNASNRDVLRFDVSDEIELQVVSGGTAYNKKSVAKYRDPSAWYHIVAVYDSANATADYRIRLYVNGSEITSSTGTDPTSGLDSTINNSDKHYVGTRSSSGSPVNFWGGYVAELNFIDGSVLTPSSFGETNEDTGQWIPKKYSGSYGTNGFYLKFVSGALGTDSSGNSNTFSATNLANHDVVTDTPTNNFATLNPLYTGSVSNAFYEGNLTIVTPSTGYGTSTATIVPTSGKYYAEFKGTTSGDNGNYGVRDVSMAATNSTWLPDGSTKNMAYQGSNGNIYYNGSSVLSSAPATFTTNDVIAVAIDYDNSTVKWYKNNSLQYTATSADLENVTFAAGDSGNSAGLTAEANFGQKTLAYTPPSGYVALSTANLPDPAIPLPEEQFNTVLYAGTGSAQTISGVGFQPDFLWIKCRSAETWHNLRDAVRGNNKESFSNSTYQEVDAAGGARAMTFESDGFAWGSSSNSGDVNGSGRNYVSWNWKANGSGSTDTSGDIDAVVSANQAAGFSIVTWTATGSNTATIPHGLGVAPEIIFYKSRSASGNWNTWTTAIDGSNDSLLLNDEAAKSDNSGIYGNLTSSVFPNWGLGNGITMVAYAFASKSGYSKIGAYTGNNAADGPFVNLGFRPAWVMVKRTDGGNEWIIVDVKRDISNVTSHRLFPNLYDAESTSQSPMDILSNGFKLRTSAGIYNAAGTYLYMAFAESPFKTANAR